MNRPAVRQPLQERSRRSLEAIYSAAVELLADGGWDAVTVGEIERRSGVTRGTFYLRFETREALVDYVNQRLTAEVRTLQEETFRPLTSGGPLGLDEASRLAVDGVAAVFRGVGRLMMHSDQIGRLPSTPEAIGELSADIIGVLRRAIPTTRSTELATQFMVEIIFAAFVARQRTESPFHAHRRLSDQEFAEQLASTVTAYLSHLS